MKPSASAGREGATGASGACSLVVQVARADTAGAGAGAATGATSLCVAVAPAVITIDAVVGAKAEES